METRIHPQAVVDPGAVLGQGVEIGPFAVIGAGVVLGDRTKVGAGAQVQGPTVLGCDNVLHPHAAVGFEPQDLKFKGEETRLVVGDRNQFREFCTIHRGTGSGGGLTTIGHDNLFMVYTHVAHDCVVGSHTVFSNNGTLAGHVTVEDHAVVGAFSSVHQFCRVGRHAYIGGYSVVTRDPLPFVKTVGAKPVCYGVNRIGLERKGFASERLAVLERAYRILVRSRQPSEPALAALEQELGGEDDVQYLLDFVRTSQRGVIRDLPGGKKGSRGG